MDKILIILILLSLAAITLVIKLVRDTDKSSKEEGNDEIGELDSKLITEEKVEVEKKPKKLEKKDMREDILAYSKNVIEEYYRNLPKKNMDLDIKISDKLFIEFEKSVWKEGLEHIVNIFNEESKRSSKLNVRWEKDLSQLKIKNEGVALSEKDLRDLLYPFENANEKADKGVAYSDMDDYSWKLFIKVEEESTEIIFRKI